MALFYPPKAPSRASNAELKLRAAFAKLGDDWHVLQHSVWQAPRRGREADGESNFIVMHQRHGILVVEVKGGGVVVDKGEWTATDRNDWRHRLADPFKQVVDGKMRLVRFRDALGHAVVGVPRIEHAVAFPDIRFDQPCADQPAEVIWDARDLGEMEAALLRTFRHWETRSTHEATSAQIEAFAGRLAPTLSIRRTVAVDIGESEAQVIEFTARQRETFQILRRMRRAVVTGGAGTGKTLLAIEKAKQMASTGARVLVTCFNKPLGQYLARELAGTGVTALHIHALTSQLSKDVGLGPLTVGSDAVVDQAIVGMLRSVANVPGQRKPFDALIVDEVQDFFSDWIDALIGLLSSKDAPVFLFADDHQRLYRDALKLEDWLTFPLDRNCRNTWFIARKAALAIGDPEPARVGSVKGAFPPFVDIGDDPEATVREVVNRLVVEERVRSEQIAVLCDARAVIDQLRGRELDGVRFAEYGAGGITAETIHRFKGLESEAVIMVIASDEVSHVDITKLLYVGLSRARSYLVVVGHPWLSSRLQMTRGGRRRGGRAWAP